MSTYQIDPNRLWVRQEGTNAPYDTSAPDAVWVAVTGPSMESLLHNPEIPRNAGIFVANKYGAVDGIDAEEGPMPDDGTVAPSFEQLATADGTTSVNEYLKMAAKMALHNKAGATQYVRFFRFRRFHLL